MLTTTAGKIFLGMFYILVIIMIILVCLWGNGNIGTNNKIAESAKMEKLENDQKTKEKEKVEVVDDSPKLEEIMRKGVNDFYSVSITCQVEKLSEIYEEVFGKITNGTFVEFGAYDGQSFSNTCGLADMGWRGLYIEPVPKFAEECRKRHKKNNVTVVANAVGADERTITINLGGQLSTASSAYMEVYNKTAWSKPSNVGAQKIGVKQRLLHNILQEQKINPGFEVMVVDIEGFEWEALRNFDIGMWRPKMVIIEIEDNHESFQNRTDVSDDAWNSIQERFKNLRTYFEKAGYVIHFMDHVNTVYVLK